MGKNKNKGKCKDKSSGGEPSLQGATAVARARRRASRGSDGGVDELGDLMVFPDALGISGQTVPAERTDDTEGVTIVNSKSYEGKEDDPFATPTQSQSQWENGAAPGIQIEGAAEHENEFSTARDGDARAEGESLIVLHSPALSTLKRRSGRFSNRHSMIYQKGIDAMPSELETIYHAPEGISANNSTDQGPKPDEVADIDDKTKDGKPKRPEYNEPKRRDDLWVRTLDATTGFSKLMDHHREEVKSYFNAMKNMAARLRAAPGLDPATVAWLQEEMVEARKREAMASFEDTCGRGRAVINGACQEFTNEVIDTEKREHALKMQLDDLTDPNRKSSAASSKMEDLLSRHVQRDVRVVQGSKASRKLRSRRSSKDLRRQRSLQHEESFGILGQRGKQDGMGWLLGGKTKKMKGVEGKKMKMKKGNGGGLGKLEEDGVVDEGRLSGGGDGLDVIAAPVRKGEVDQGDHEEGGEADWRDTSTDGESESEEEEEVSDGAALEHDDDEAPEEVEEQAEGGSGSSSKRSSDTIPELARPEGHGWEAAPSLASSKSRPSTLDEAEKLDPLRMSRLFTMPPAPSEVTCGGPRTIQPPISITLLHHPNKTPWRDLSWSWLLASLHAQLLPWHSLLHFLTLSLLSFTTTLKSLTLHTLTGLPSPSPTLSPAAPIPPIEDFITITYHLSILFVMGGAVAVHKERALWLQANAETREFLLELVHGTRWWPGRMMLDLVVGAGEEGWGWVKQVGREGWEVGKYKVIDLAEWFGLDDLFSRLGLDDLPQWFGLDKMSGFSGVGLAGGLIGVCIAADIVLRVWH